MWSEEMQCFCRFLQQRTLSMHSLQCFRRRSLLCSVYFIWCPKIMLTTETLSDWSNARRLVSKHEKTKLMTISLINKEASIFLRGCDKEQLVIPHHMTKSQYELIQHNTKVLHALHLQQHLKSCPRNAKYTSHRIFKMNS